jgi:molecular chaperone DnaK (HSP70)
MHHRALALLVLLACSSGSAATSIEVEKNSPAIREGRLTQAVGIETLGGVFTAFLDVGCSVPCETTQIFSTGADNQTEISIAMFRGTAGLAAENHSLGRFTIVDIPEATRGQPQIAVTLRADATSILLSARGLEGISIRLLRDEH